MAEKQSPIRQTTLTRRPSSCFGAVVGFLVLAGQLTLATAATPQERYYAHAAVQDRDGVIEIRLSAPGGEAMLRALEIIPSGVGGQP